METTEKTTGHRSIAPMKKSLPKGRGRGTAERWMRMSESLLLRRSNKYKYQNITERK